MSAYKDALTTANTALSTDPRTRFVGYGLTTGRAYGTLRDVPAAQLIETTVAENLMVGLATGLSLGGHLPVVFLERADFALNCLDALVNHLFAIRELSRGEFAPAAILRLVVGNRTKPLFTGPTHTRDLTAALRALVGDDAVLPLTTAENVTTHYAGARQRQLSGHSTLLVEYKDLL
jgi:pyruvate/2-oxoglutarate/acetoin dehydrogenase E1 component